MTSGYPVIKGSLLFSEHYTWNTADSVGRGASAVVFLGRHKTRGTVVAIKVFHDHLALGYKQDALRELELLRQLDHSNIIKLLDIEKEANSQKTVLVMEYCEGGSLHHMLDKPEYYYGLPESEYLLVLSHVAAGMSYLREKNVIHRDIKPGNIMRYLTMEGFSVYKLTDFGAARCLDEDENFMSLYGTEEYLHPGIYERAVLKLPTAQSFDAKVDLWSLGVTFYHTATGQLPFQPYGGRQNRQTMFEIITQKETGVISGVQTFQNGPITWKRDLPETCLLSSGLKSIVVPLLAGLMEPNEAKMISYESFFKIVENVKQKTRVSVFHFSRCEDLKVYADLNMTLPGLQDLIASLTDISASDQILLVGGHCLDQVVDPMCSLHDYPPRLLVDSIYLFQKEMSDTGRIKKPEIPPFPEFSSYSDMDTDARLAHSCASRAELIKKFQRKVQEQQQKLMDGLMYFRLYVETRLIYTKTSQEYMRLLMDDCQMHFNMFFNMVRALRDAVASRSRDLPELSTLEEILNDTVIRQVHKKATERISEIEIYREGLMKKLDEVKSFASKVSTVCREEKCSNKVNHHMSMISGVMSRFRRDKSVKQQMTSHDENIHRFERQKLQMHCVTMKSIFTDHCMKQLENVNKSALHTCESLTKCLSRVMKIEKNINSVLNCQKLLNQKLVKLGRMIDIKFVKESGYMSGQSGTMAASWHGQAGVQALTETNRPVSEPFAYVNRLELIPNLQDEARSMSDQTNNLREKLLSLQLELAKNSDIMKGFDEPLQSSGSLSHQFNPTQMTDYMNGLISRSQRTSDSTDPVVITVDQISTFQPVTSVQSSDPPDFPLLPTGMILKSDNNMPKSEQNNLIMSMQSASVDDSSSYGNIPSAAPVTTSSSSSNFVVEFHRGRGIYKTPRQETYIESSDGFDKPLKKP